MSTIIREIEIEAPQQKVWQALADFGNIAQFNPGVPESHLTSEQREGIGATRHCDLTTAGGALEERIIDWQAGQQYTVEIYDGKKLPPVEYIRVTLSAQSDGVGTRAATHMEYKLKYGPIGALMDRLMVRKLMGQGMEGLLAGLKHYVETGEAVESVRQVNLQAVATPA